MSKKAKAEMMKAIRGCAAGGEIEEMGEDPAEEAGETSAEEAAEENAEKGQEAAFPRSVGKKKKKKKAKKKK